MKKILIHNSKIILPTILAIIIASFMWNRISFEFNNPKIKKPTEAAIKYKFRFSPFFSGHKPSIKKTTKNNKPKLLLEL